MTWNIPSPSSAQKAGIETQKALSGDEMMNQFELYGTRITESK